MNKLLSDAIHIVFVELSKLGETAKKHVGDIIDLEKWAVSFRYASDRAHQEAMNRVIEYPSIMFPTNLPTNGVN